MIGKRYCLTPEEWAYAKAELVLAEKLGLIENADIEALEKRCAEKNEENAKYEKVEIRDNGIAVVTGITGKTQTINLLKVKE